MSDWLEEICRIGAAYWQTRLLLTAAELDVVTVLGGAQQDRAENPPRARRAAPRLRASRQRPP